MQTFCEHRGRTRERERTTYAHVRLTSSQYSTQLWLLRYAPPYSFVAASPPAQHLLTFALSAASPANSPEFQHGVPAWHAAAPNDPNEARGSSATGQQRARDDSRCRGWS